VGTEHGWTFIYIKDASELPRALQFAKQYQPALVFAEDVDRHVTGERTDKMDMILNTLDGIDTKHTEIMVVLTTNHLDQVNQAMLRPGRLDVILNIVPPDAKAVERLVRVYARGRLDGAADLARAGELLAGFTPAVVREVVERAKLGSISRTGRADATLLGIDIEISAETMVQQQALLKKPEPVVRDWSASMVAEIGSQVYNDLKANGIGSQIHATHEATKEILNRL
jgi:transitional endoplasmic reticulum ATPase